MSEFKDCAIKLFGKTIPLSLNQDVSCNDEPSTAASVVDPDASTVGAAGESSSDQKLLLLSSSSSSQEDEEADGDKETSGEENSEKDNVSDQIAEDSKDHTPSDERETSSLKSSKSGEQSEISTSQEKTLKKPDKILPCPRCNSMDTKFCYYNNYNVNQPRHFCKNCQRYWTAGGTMRNVPVGAGRRKNKNSSASQYRHLVISDVLQKAQANAAIGVHNPTLGSNGTVLTFGADSPLCKSIASTLNLVDRAQNSAPNGFHGPENKVIVSNGGGLDNADNQSSGSSMTASASSDKGGKPVIKDYQGFPSQVPCFPGPPWPYPWNSAQWTSALPPPSFCHSGFPVSFYPPPPPFWGSTLPGPWSVPCFSSPSSATNHSTSALGKHSRDGEILNPASTLMENNSSTERCVLIPKTLRIDDPTEAAKSSIWTTLGLNNEKLSSISGGVLYKAFQSKGDSKNRIIETSPVLQANPAALSRSLTFLESN